MTELIINGLPAELAEDASFTYFEESRYFDDASGYTLDIELPLRGSTANRAIFGYIERQPPASASWPATLTIDDITRRGTVLLTDITATTLKVQFLYGGSTDDYNRLEKTYVNEIPDLRDAIRMKHSQALWDYHPDNVVQPLENFKADWNGTIPFDDEYRIMGDLPAVALPWKNDTEGSCQNEQFPRVGIIGHYATHAGMSWMPYLRPLAKRIAEAMGYSASFGAWERDAVLNNLIMCNVLPAAEYPQLVYHCGAALPRWTVKEFFQNLEPLLGGRFTFDHLRRTISFENMTSLLERCGTVELTDVEDEHSLTSSFGMEETEGNYLRSKPYRYASADIDSWKWMDCPWIIAQIKENRMTFPDYDSFVKFIRTDSFSRSRLNHGKIFYIEELDAWFCLKASPQLNKVPDKKNQFKYSYAICPLAINLFGPEKYDDSADDDYTELNVLPAPIADGWIHLAPSGGYDMTAFLMDGGDPETEEEEVDEITIEASDYMEAYAQADVATYQTPVVDAISNGEPDSDTSAYDKLFVAYWGGRGDDPELTTPAVAGFRYNSLFKSDEPFSMRINTPRGQPYAGIPRIDESVKYTFGFLADTFPPVDAIYHINSRRWICRRLQVTFSPRGRSRRITGEFYPIIESAPGT